MPGTDPTHWLYRLSTDEWLSAARHELGQCATALSQRAYRSGITHARRAAGMALNAVLIARGDVDWGRSYMDHLAAVARAEDVDAPVREAAARLLATPPRQPELVSIGKADTGALEAARAVLHWAEGALSATSSTDRGS